MFSSYMMSGFVKRASRHQFDWYFGYSLASQPVQRVRLRECA